MLAGGLLRSYCVTHVAGRPAHPCRCQIHPLCRLPADPLNHVAVGSIHTFASQLNHEGCIQTQPHVLSSVRLTKASSAPPLRPTDPRSLPPCPQACPADNLRGRLLSDPRLFAFRCAAGARKAPQHGAGGAAPKGGPPAPAGPHLRRDVYPNHGPLQRHCVLHGTQQRAGAARGGGAASRAVLRV
eukprot:366381-Chlamydomonas_euryale.AAC.14